MLKKLLLGKLETNCYVVYNNENEAIVIDPGANGQKVSKYISEHELDLKAILLTHGHFDHIGAVDYLYERYQCDIYTHQETLALLHDSQLNLSIYDQPFVIGAPVIAAPENMNIAGYPIQWLLLEGHCQGSSMIYFPEEKFLFSGDVLFAGEVGRFDLPTSSHLKTKETLKTIKNYSFQARLLPGHGDESTLQHEQQYNSYLQP